MTHDRSGNTVASWRCGSHHNGGCKKRQASGQASSITSIPTSPRRFAGQQARDKHRENKRFLVAEQGRARQLHAELDALLREVQDFASDNEPLCRKLAIKQAITEGPVTRLPLPVY